MPWWWPKFRTDATSSSNDEKISSKWEPAGSGRAKGFLPPYPDDFQIYTPGISISGISFRKIEAFAFANSRDQTLGLEQEQGNSHDPNAIRVIGISKRGRAHIGYIPKDVAAHIARSGMFEMLRARLDRIYEAAASEGDREWNGSYLEIRIQIIGPKEMKAQFQGAVKKQRTRKTT